MITGYFLDKGAKAYRCRCCGNDVGWVNSTGVAWSSAALEGKVLLGICYDCVNVESNEFDQIGYYILSRKEYPWKLGYYQMVQGETPLVKLNYTQGFDESQDARYISLDLIETASKFRNKGYASEVLKTFLKVHQNEDVYLLIDPGYDKSMDLKRLHRWYESFGFEDVEDKHNMPFNYNMKLTTRT